jgi:hypothetical protein
MQNWLLGGGLAIIIGILGVILRVSYKIGGDARELSQGLTRITKLEVKIEEKLILITSHDLRLGTLEKNVQDVFDRQHSDIKELRQDIKELNRRPGSRPNFEDGEEGNEE